MEALGWIIGFGIIFGVIGYIVRRKRRAGLR
jgi:hypothetical protein